MDIIRAKVTNNSGVVQRVRTAAGVVEIAAGRARAVEMLHSHLQRAKDRSFLVVNVEQTEEMPASELIQRTGAVLTGLEARHKGAGRYSIFQGEDEIAGGLTKDEAEIFNALSDEDKAASVAKAS